MTSISNVSIPSYTFGGWQFQRSLGGLVGGDGTLKPLRAKTLKVFELLHANVDQIVPKECIISTVWPDTVTGDDSLVQCMIEIRRSLGDIDKRILVTCPRIGYRLVSDSQPRAMDAGNRASESWLPPALRGRAAMFASGVVLTSTVFTLLWLPGTTDERRLSSGSVTDGRLTEAVDADVIPATQRSNVPGTYEPALTSAMERSGFEEQNPAWSCTGSHADEQCLQPSTPVPAVPAGYKKLQIDMRFRTAAGVEITRRYYYDNAHSWWSDGSMWNTGSSQPSITPVTF